MIVLGSQSGEDTQPNSEVEVEQQEQQSSSEAWQAYVRGATNVSQLYLALELLDESVMWNKSVLKAKCRVCHKIGIENQLLICDECNGLFINRIDKQITSYACRWMPHVLPCPQAQGNP